MINKRKSYCILLVIYIVVQQFANWFTIGRNKKSEVSTAQQRTYLFISVL